MKWPAHSGLDACMMRMYIYILIHPQFMLTIDDTHTNQTLPLVIFEQSVVDCSSTLVYTEWGGLDKPVAVVDHGQGWLAYKYQTSSSAFSLPETWVRGLKSVSVNQPVLYH